MGDRLPVNCGVRSERNKFVLTYKLGQNVDKKSISWEWELAEGGNFVAKLEAKTQSGDVKYHNSAPIPGVIHSQLGKPDKSKDGEFYKVELKKKSAVTDITKFFEVAQ